MTRYGTDVRALTDKQRETALAVRLTRDMIDREYRVLLLLDLYGPMTAAKVATHLGCSRSVAEWALIVANARGLAEWLPARGRRANERAVLYDRWRTARGATPVPWPADVPLGATS